jgi:hypothetical protein
LERPRHRYKQLQGILQEPNYTWTIYSFLVLSAHW